MLKTFNRIESLPAESEEKISDEEAKKIILESSPRGSGTAVAENDVLGIKAGTSITVESTESVAIDLAICRNSG